MSERESSVVTYTVHEPPSPNADRVDRADELVFVKDGFSWVTALCPPIGLISKRLWLELIAYLAAAAAAAGLMTWAGADTNWIALVILAMGAYLGFEISTFERLALDRDGWDMLGTVTGKNLAECERRFFESWLPDQPVISATKARPMQAGSAAGGWPFGAKA